MYGGLARGEKNCVRRAIGQKVSQEMLNAHRDKIKAQIRSFFGVISCADDKSPAFEKISVEGKWTKNCETYDFSIFGAYKYKDTLYRVEKYARIYTDIVYSGFIDSIDEKFRAHAPSITTGLGGVSSVPESRYRILLYRHSYLKQCTQNNLYSRNRISNNTVPIVRQNGFLSSAMSMSCNCLSA